MLEIRNLHKAFNKGTEFENQIFQGLDLSIEAQTSTAIIGPNGCGKSTLLNLIAGSIKADQGEIKLGEEIITDLSEKDRAQYFGRVHQDPSKGVSPSLSILENMALADNKNNKYGLKFLVNKSRIDDYKDQLSSLNLGLENMLDRKVSLLSGGQRQSLSILMAAMKRPKLLLLDEHTAALDPKTSKVVMNKTKELLNNRNITTLMITHNMSDAVNYSDRVIMLKEGEIVLDESADNLSVEDLEKMYQETKQEEALGL